MVSMNTIMFLCIKLHSFYELLNTNEVFTLDVDDPVHMSHTWILERSTAFYNAEVDVMVQNRAILFVETCVFC